MKVKVSLTRKGSGGDAGSREGNRARRFLLTYGAPSDPSSQEVERAVERLRDVHVLDVMPGTILVEGNERCVRIAASTLNDWLLSPEGRLKAPSPARGRVKK